VDDGRHRQVRRAGDRVVGERAGQELALLVVHELLEQPVPDALCQSAEHLPVDDRRVDHPAAVVDDDVAKNLHVARSGVDLDDRGVEPGSERDGGRLEAAAGLEAGPG
jgi:hypothetical protein